MSSLSKAFKTDKALERDGVDVQLVQNDDGTWVTFRIARAGANNPAYQKIADRVMKPFRRAQQVGAVPAEKINALTREIFAEAGVIGWSNVPKSAVTGIETDDVGEDGKPVYVPYSKEGCIALFENLPDLYTTLIEMSVQHATFTAVNVEEDGKNLKRS